MHFQHALAYTYIAKDGWNSTKNPIRPAGRESVSIHQRPLAPKTEKNSIQQLTRRGRVHVPLAILTSDDVTRKPAKNHDPFRTLFQIFFRGFLARK